MPGLDRAPAAGAVTGHAGHQRRSAEAGVHGVVPGDVGARPGLRGGRRGPPRRRTAGRCCWPAGALYLVGVLGLTAAYHIPRNDALARLDPRAPGDGGGVAALLHRVGAHEPRPLGRRHRRRGPAARRPAGRLMDRRRTSPTGPTRSRTSGPARSSSSSPRPTRS